MISDVPKKLSAVIPVGDYFLHKNNIKKIMQHSISVDVELIIVLDRQSVEAYEDLRELIAELNIDVRITTSNSGNPGGARNIGIKSATSEWITFWDCDDEPNVSSVLYLIDSLKATDYQILIGSYESIFGDTRNSRIISGKKRNWQIELGLNPGIWRFVFNREFLKNSCFPEARMGEDQLFLQRVLNSNPKVFLSKAIIYGYRLDVPNQLTSRQSNLNDLTMINRKALDEFLPKGEYTLLVRTMIMRQLLTISRNGNLHKYSRFSYLMKALIWLVLNPKIFCQLIKEIFK
jgi:glycosyltransferase involved in cell wall biosynthesis